MRFFKLNRIIPTALATVLAADLLLSISACGEKEPSFDDRETFPVETYETVDGAVVSFQDGVARDAYPADTPVGEWLTGCSADDRDDQFDAYTLRHESAADGHTTFTYLIYYPHGGSALSARSEVLEGEGGYVINIHYSAGGGTEGYSLCTLSVTLPTEETPRLRLLLADDPLGVMSTVSASPIH